MRATLGALAGLAALAALAHSLGGAASRGAVVLVGSDPFLNSYFGNSHARQRQPGSARGSSWKDTLKKLKGMQVREEKARRLRSEQEFAADWSRGAASAKPKEGLKHKAAARTGDPRSAFDSMEAMVSSHMKATQALEEAKLKGIGMGGDVDVGALRAHAREHEVKLASKESRVKFHSAMPSFNSHVQALEKSLGETVAPPRPVHFRGQTQSAEYHTRFISADGKVGSQLANLSKELSAEKEAGQLADHQAMAKVAKAWSKGAKRAMKVEDDFSRPMRDITASARQPEDDVLRTFA